MGNSSNIKKIAAIIVTLLILLIPLAFIFNIIKDRKNYRTDAEKSVASAWADYQIIFSPEMYFVQKKEKENETKYLKLNDYDVNVIVNTELRKKGIFNIPVYTADVILKGDFINEYGNLAGKELTLSFNIQDSTGFVSDPYFGINNNNPMVSHSTEFVSYLNTAAKSIPFEITYKIRGINKIFVMPKGQNNTVYMSGNWGNPSFEGDFLPDERIVSSDNFTARWSIPGITVNSRDRDLVSYAKAGVSMLVPVDNYRMAERTLKYAFLFLSLTFLSYFIFEVISKENNRIHPIQYCLLGGSMLIFYLLLVSISEFLPFLSAYIISAAMIIILISLYTYFVITKKENPVFAFIITLILIVLYSFLYILLSLQDFALLMGSIGLFIIIAIIMYITRNIDWYK